MNREKLELAIKEREEWGSTDLYEVGYLAALKQVLTDLEGEGKVMDKIWGYGEGYCAWCLDVPATKEYEGSMPSDMGKAMYQVCDNCYEERA